ncbi:shugoshin 2 [Dipodomys merriami]|uniref:shugoshin 2 n=1 Tax=Dipodomys merriami TaxID=94247 RepID=UPI003855D002
MEYPRMEANSVTSVIKRRVKDKRTSKMKLNVSLASKIKTKILNNSSIFKISLKHNNRALAQALSKEKETSRRITTEKMLLQKEVEKLNFENTFLRLKLNNLNKKLIEIESLMNNNLITAIEMSSLSEFHQSSFLLPASQKKQMSKQCKLMRLPFARVPLTSDDDDDDIDNGKEETQHDNIVPKTSPNISSSLSTRQSISTHCNLEMLFLKEDNQNMYNLGDSEHISSTDSALPIESHYHSDQTSKNSLVSEIRSDSSISHRRENSSLNNVTERKKRQSSWESKDPIIDISSATELDHQQISNSGINWNNEIDDCINEKNIKMQRNMLSSESASESNVKYMNQVQSNDDFHLKKTVHENADIDLPASEVSKIVVSRGSKNKRIKKTSCGVETFRKVRIPSSEEKRERSKKKCKSSSDVDIEEKIENRPEGQSIPNGKNDAEDPNLVFDTEKPIEVNILKKITLRNDFDQGDRQNTHYNTMKKRIHETDEQEEAYSFSQSLDIVLQENKFDMGQNSITYDKSKASRQTFVIQRLEKDNLDTTSQNPDGASEFQMAHLSFKDYGTVYDYETQNILGFKKYVTDTQPAKQNESEVNTLRQKVNRRTEIISEVSQVSDQDKSNNFPQTQVNKETISQSLENSKQFQIPTLFTRDNGNLHSDEIQNVFGLQKQITDVYPIPQNKSKVKQLRQKVNRKTKIISEMNFDSEKSLSCSKKDNSLFIQKDNEIILGNLKDSREFQTPGLCTKDSGNLCDYETQSILEMKTHVYDKQPAYQNDSKIDKFRQKAYRKTEVISEVKQTYETDNKGGHDLEKDHIVSSTQKDTDTISENLEIANEFQIADLPTQESRNFCDHETQSVLDLEKHVTNKQVAQQNELKVNKKVRLKVNRRTEIISRMDQIYEDIDVHDQKTDINDYLKNQSKQNRECQDITNEPYMKVNSNEKESCDQIPNPYQVLKKHGKKSSAKAKNSLTREKSKSILLLTDSSQAPVTLESDLKHITKEADSEPGNQIELLKNQKQSTVTQNTERDIPSMGVEEEKCSVNKVNKRTSKSKKRKTFLKPPDTQEVIKIIPDTDHRQPVHSSQANKENYLESEKIVQMKSDFCTKELKPSLSEKYSSYIQNSSFNSAQDCSIPLSISSTNLIQENCVLESLPIFPVGDIHEKIKAVKLKVNQRTKQSEIGKNKLQDLTNTCFISNNTAQLENEFKDLSSDLPNRKRRCISLNFKEPDLRRQVFQLFHRFL